MMKGTSAITCLNSFRRRKGYLRVDSEECSRPTRAEQMEEAQGAGDHLLDPIAASVTGVSEGSDKSGEPQAAISDFRRSLHQFGNRHLWAYGLLCLSSVAWDHLIVLSLALPRFHEANSSATSNAMEVAIGFGKGRSSPSKAEIITSS